MAYCKRCGAYIPDGLSACLACGYDEAGEQASAQTYEREQHEDLREQYEQERKKQQETSRKWAEQEYERRQTAQKRREEELRRQAEQREQGREQAKAYAERVKSGINTAAKSNNKLVAALSYLSILFLLPRFLCPDDDFARYHARQGLTLFVFGIICDAISAMFPIGWLLSLFRLYCIYKGMTNALNGRKEPLPYIGQYGEKKE